jgi:hypothetical protein
MRERRCRTMSMSCNRSSIYLYLPPTRIQRAQLTYSAHLVAHLDNVHRSSPPHTATCLPLLRGRTVFSLCSPWCSHCQCHACLRSSDETVTRREAPACQWIFHRSMVFWPSHGARSPCMALASPWWDTCSTLRWSTAPAVHPSRMCELHVHQRYWGTVCHLWSDSSPRCHEDFLSAFTAAPLPPRSPAHLEGQRHPREAPRRCPPARRHMHTCDREEMQRGRGWSEEVHGRRDSAYLCHKLSDRILQLIDAHTHLIDCHAHARAHTGPCMARQQRQTAGGLVRKMATAAYSDR